MMRYVISDASDEFVPLEKLPEKDFMRVHRSFIVPLSRIEKVRNKNLYLSEETIPKGASFEKKFFEVYKES